jgi:short-subunit dehydrogenase
MSFNPPITNWQDTRVWVIGASTGIGAALAGALALRGARVAISARRQEALKAIASRHDAGQVLATALDITQPKQWQSAAGEVIGAWQGIDLAVFMAGDYKPMRAWEIDLAIARNMVETNLMGFYNGLAVLVPQMLRQGGGQISLVSSVAGYRGLPRSLVYGPTKAALINLAEALYIDLSERGIGVSVVNPGFVRTPLTDQNEFRMPALITPEEAAEAMIEGYEAGEFEIHFPKRFTRSMKVLQHLPYRAFFKAVKKFTGNA